MARGQSLKKSQVRSEVLRVRLSPEEWRRLQERVHREGRNVSEILRDAVPPAQD